METGPETEGEPGGEHGEEQDVKHGSNSGSDPGISRPETSCSRKGTVVVSEPKPYQAFWIFSCQFSSSFADSKAQIKRMILTWKK